MNAEELLNKPEWKKNKKKIKQFIDLLDTDEIEIDSSVINPLLESLEPLNIADKILLLYQMTAYFELNSDKYFIDNNSQKFIVFFRNVLNTINGLKPSLITNELLLYYWIQLIHHLMEKLQLSDEIWENYNLFINGLLLKNYRVLSIKKFSSISGLTSYRVNLIESKFHSVENKYIQLYIDGLEKQPKMKLLNIDIFNNKRNPTQEEIEELKIKLL